MALRFGIDMGGTTAKLAVVDDRFRVVWNTSVTSSGDPTPQLLVKMMAAVSKEAIKKFKIKKVGVGVAGDINSRQGIVRISPNLGWKNVPLKKLIDKSFKCSSSVDNDANVAAWGIYKTQVSPKIKNVIVVTLGTGVGGGLILDGKLYQGATGSAGEIGHTRIDEAGPLCNCGNRGCLETYAGGFHMARLAKEKLNAGQPSLLQDLFKADSNNITPFAIAEAANKGDSFAQKIWNDVGDVLGRALGDLIYVLNPDAIFLTGGVAQAGELDLSPIRENLLKRTFQTPVKACPIKVAKDAPHIGVIGASLL